MTYFIEPEKLIIDFLRANLTDPRRRAETIYTEFFTGDGSTSEYSLSPPKGSAATITSASVDSTAISKWKDFYLDYDNGKIILTSSYGALADDSELEVSYKFGTTNWIFDNRPMKSLSSQSYPRISINVVANSAIRLGNFSAPVSYTPRFEVIVYSKPKGDGQVFDVVTGYSGTTAVIRKMQGNKLSKYLAYEITNAFEDSEDDLHPLLFDYIPLVAPSDDGFDKFLNTHNIRLEFTLNGINIGKI